MEHSQPLTTNTIRSVTKKRAQDDRKSYCNEPFRPEIHDSIPVSDSLDRLTATHTNMIHERLLAVARRSASGTGSYQAKVTATSPGFPPGKLRISARSR